MSNRKRKNKMEGDLFAGVVAWVESLRGRMGESTRGVEGLFESLLTEAFSWKNLTCLRESLVFRVSCPCDGHD